VLARGVDALVVTWHGDVTERAFSELEEARKAADESRLAGGRPVVVELYGESFRVALGARAPYRFLLGGEDYKVTVAPNAAPGGGQVRIECVPASIWTHGADALVERGRKLARRICGGFPGETVSRVDLAVDVQGLELDGSPEELSAFLTRGPVGRALHDLGLEAREGDETVRYFDRGATFTGYTFGAGGPISARLYLKTVEIAVKRKAWVRELWSRTEFDGVADCWEALALALRPVWRVEFELKRDGLAELGMQRWEPLRLDPVWGYLVGRDQMMVVAPPGWHPPYALLPSGPWLSKRERTFDSHRTRWPLSWWWRRLQRVRFAALDQVASARERQRCSDAETLLSITRGCLKSFAAVVGIDEADPEAAIDALTWALRHNWNREELSRAIRERRELAELSARR
jgi:hypothetical protein